MKTEQKAQPPVRRSSPQQGPARRIKKRSTLLSAAAEWCAAFFEYLPVWWTRFKKRRVRNLRQFLRKCYRLGAPMCIFIASVALVVLTGTILLLTVPASRRAKQEAAALQLAEQEEQVVRQAQAEEARIVYEEAIAAATATPLITPELRFEKGSEGDDVMTIQSRLMALGYLAIDEPTSHFGNATRDAVKLFQRQHELDQDGIIGNMTYDLLMSEEAKPYVMYEGAEGADIKSFQEMLSELGYLEDGQITGYYGTDTVSAVEKFQKRNKLHVDGKAGEQTLETINSADARVSYEKEKEIEAEKKKLAAAAAKNTVEGRVNSLISVAKSQLGKPYVLGDRGPDSFDCSGFVYYCLRKVDVYCRRLNAAGYARNGSWEKISSMSDLKKGDLLFFKSDDDSTVGHVGIYIGSGEMIDASSGNGKVVRRSCRSPYWKRNFVCARRPIK